MKKESEVQQNISFKINILFLIHFKNDVVNQKNHC